MMVWDKLVDGFFNWLDHTVNGTGKADEKLSEPLGQLDTEKAAQDAEDRRRERKRNAH